MLTCAPSRLADKAPCSDATQLDVLDVLDVHDRLPSPRWHGLTLAQLEDLLEEGKSGRVGAGVVLGLTERKDT